MAESESCIGFNQLKRHSKKLDADREHKKSGVLGRRSIRGRPPVTGPAEDARQKRTVTPPTTRLGGRTTSNSS
jgi:hypothetical protein